MTFNPLLPDEENENMANSLQDLARKAFLDNNGIKDDLDKLDFTLLPWEEVEQVVQVLAFGAKKYARDNWKHVEKERYMKAALRHTISMSKGEKLDPETKLPHAAHAVCCLLFYMHLDKVTDQPSQ